MTDSKVFAHCFSLELDTGNRKKGINSQNQIESKSKIIESKKTDKKLSLYHKGTPYKHHTVFLYTV